MTLRLGGFGLLLIVGALAQTGATVPQLYVPFALKGDTARRTGTVIVDPPLVMSLDAAGVAHLSSPSFIIDPPLTLLTNAAGEKHVSVEFLTGPVPTPGTGLRMVPVTGHPDQQSIAIDTSQVLYRVNAAPVIGAACPGDAGVVWDRAYVYVCVPPDPAAPPPADGSTGWTWAGAALTLTSPAAK